jgi:hypothetical protein
MSNKEKSAQSDAKEKSTIKPDPTKLNRGYSRKEARRGHL